MIVTLGVLDDYRELRVSGKYRLYYFDPYYTFITWLLRLKVYIREDILLYYDGYWNIQITFSILFIV